MERFQNSTYKLPVVLIIDDLGQKIGDFSEIVLIFQATTRLQPNSRKPTKTGPTSSRSTARNSGSSTNPRTTLNSREFHNRVVGEKFS